MKLNPTAKRLTVLILALQSVALIGGAWAETQATAAKENAKIISQAYPSLASSALSFAAMDDLQGNAILQAGDVRITQKELEAETAKVPDNMKAEIRKNQFFILEQMATKALLMQLAKAAAPKTPDAATSRTEGQMINEYLKGVVAKLEVTDQEVARFYEENKDACGGASLDQMKDQLKKFVLEQKQQAAVTEHVRTLGQKMPIAVSAAWTREQAKLAMDNLVDKARASGRPTMVDFGSVGCRPCDMMAPILKELEKKYEGKANVLFVHVGQEQVLAARYGIQSIPIQVFFDKAGKEISRHTGFYPQAEIEKKLAEMGAN
ncbi:MAG: thioredoxin family protein [Candidatus Sumerlaeota bacterium]|nr:thioredoxin family protein [Candidatus Sumerlaeota bacterium]